VFTIDDLWRIMHYLKDGTTDPNLSELTTTLATSEKELVTKYFEQIIDQNTMTTNDMKRLRQMIIDWYTSHRTIATTQRHSSDIHQMPNNQLSELFRSFGFEHGLNLVPLTTKANFFLDLVNFYKKKGTPETLVDVLDYYGFSDTDLIEYWLQKDQYNNLVFRGESVRLAASGSTLLLETDVPFEKMTGSDPHWIQTAGSIESLIQTNKISLPSKSPYYSLSSIFALYNITISLSILFRVVEDQYDRFMLGLELPENTAVKNLGVLLPILHVFVATCYTFQRLFGDGIISTFTRYGCYDGVIDYQGDPPVPLDLSNITEIYEELISRPISRDDRTARIQSIVDDWSRPMSQNFLNSIGSAESLLDAMNPEFKETIDSWFDTGDESYLITYMIGTLDNWIRLNVDSKSPSLVITMLGLGFRKELYEILNFFKPYRARLAFMDTAFSFKNPLTESVMLDEWMLTQIGSYYHDSIRPPSFPCNKTQAEIDLETLMSLTWQWDTGRFFDDPPRIPEIPGAKDPFPPVLCDNLEWLYDACRRYDVPMPPEYLNFSYDSGGYYDILPILQKCFLEALKHHPGGGICDSWMIEIGMFFHDRIGRTNHYNQNWDTGSFFDSGTEHAWYDTMDVDPEQNRDDVVTVDDDGFNHEIMQTMSDNFGLEPPMRMDVGNSYDTLVTSSPVRDVFEIWITSNARATVTTTVGKYPSIFDSGNTFDGITNLDVVGDGRIIEYLSSTVTIQSSVVETIGIDFGRSEVLTSSINVVSAIEVDLEIVGLPVALSAFILATNVTTAIMSTGTTKEKLTGTLIVKSNIYDTELTQGDIESLSGVSSVTTEVDTLLSTGIVKLLSSAVASVIYTVSEMRMGFEEYLESTSNITSNSSSDLLVVSSVYITRSIVIDVENNHGDPVNMGLMGIRFSNFGNIVDIGVPNVDFSAYATTTLPSGSYAPWRLFYNSIDLTGSPQNWLANEKTTNQRIICNVGVGIGIDEILFHNYHQSGTDTDKGIRNIKIYFSNDIISDKVYGNPVSNGVLVYNGSINEHTPVNEEDPQSVILGTYSGSVNISSYVNNVDLGVDLVSGNSTIISYVNDSDLSVGVIEELSSSITVNSNTNVDTILSIGTEHSLEAYCEVDSDVEVILSVPTILLSSTYYEIDTKFIDTNDVIWTNSYLNHFVESNIYSELTLGSTDSLSSSIDIISYVLGGNLILGDSEILSSSNSTITLVTADLSLGADVSFDGFVNIISNVEGIVTIGIVELLSSIIITNTDVTVDLLSTGVNETLSGTSVVDSTFTAALDMGVLTIISGTSTIDSISNGILVTGGNEELSSNITIDSNIDSTLNQNDIILTGNSTSSSIVSDILIIGTSEILEGTSIESSNVYGEIEIRNSVLEANCIIISDVTPLLSFGIEEINSSVSNIYTAVDGSLIVGYNEILSGSSNSVIDILISVIDTGVDEELTGSVEIINLVTSELVTGDNEELSSNIDIISNVIASTLLSGEEEILSSTTNVITSVDSNITMGVPVALANTRINVTTNVSVATLVIGDNEDLTSPINVTSVVSLPELYIGINEILTGSSNITTDIISILGVEYVLNSITNVISNVSAVIDRGDNEELTGVVGITTLSTGLIFTGDNEILTGVVDNYTNVNADLVTGNIEELTGVVNNSTDVNADLVTGDNEELTSIIGITTTSTSMLVLGENEILIGMSEVIVSSDATLINDLVINATSNIITNASAFPLVSGENEELSSTITITTDTTTPELEVPGVNEELAGPINITTDVSSYILVPGSDLLTSTIDITTDIISSDLVFTGENIELSGTSESKIIFIYAYSLDIGMAIIGSSNSTINIDSIIDISMVIIGSANSISDINADLVTGDNEELTSTIGITTLSTGLVLTGDDEILIGTDVLTTNVYDTTIDISNDTLDSTSTTTSEFDADLTVV
jgi:hypothetical protein